MFKSDWLTKGTMWQNGVSRLLCGDDQISKQEIFEEYLFPPYPSNSDSQGDKRIKTTATIIMKLKIFQNTVSLKHLKSILTKRCMMSKQNTEHDRVNKGTVPLIDLHSPMIPHFVDSKMQRFFF